jgi:8-oxo-dGTP diphosphatase
VTRPSRSRSADPSERQFLAKYDASAFPRPSVTVDLVVVTIVDAELKVLLVERGEHPFKGSLALPGGFLRVGPTPDDQGEDLDDAALRELGEETGLPAKSIYLAQLGAFGRAGRDPRTRVVSVAYYAVLRPGLAPFVRAGGDAKSAAWHSLVVLGSSPGTPTKRQRPLAFDHDEILMAALTRIRQEVFRSNLAFELVPETFSIAELRAVHEAVRGEPLDPGNFRKRFQRMLEDGLVEPAPGKRITGRKPAAVFRFATKGPR